MMYYSKHYQLVRSTHRDLCVRDRKMASDFRLKHNWTSQRCLAQKSSSVRLDGLLRLTQAWWGWTACEGQWRHLLWLPWNSCLDQIFMRGRACRCCAYQQTMCDAGELSFSFYRCTAWHPVRLQEAGWWWRWQACWPDSGARPGWCIWFCDLCLGKPCFFSYKGKN